MGQNEKTWRVAGPSCQQRTRTRIWNSCPELSRRRGFKAPGQLWAPVCPSTAPEVLSLCSPHCSQMPAVVCRGCHNKVPQRGASRPEMCFLTVLEVRSLRLRGQQGGFLQSDKRDNLIQVSWAFFLPSVRASTFRCPFL